jgi:hypothetical protein
VKRNMARENDRLWLEEREKGGDIERLKEKIKVEKKAEDKKMKEVENVSQRLKGIDRD